MIRDHITKISHSKWSTYETSQKVSMRSIQPNHFKFRLSTSECLHIQLANECCRIFRTKWCWKRLYVIYVSQWQFIYRDRHRSVDSSVPTILWSQVRFSTYGQILFLICYGNVKRTKCKRGRVWHILKSICSFYYLELNIQPKFDECMGLWYNNKNSATLGNIKWLVTDCRLFHSSDVVLFFFLFFFLSTSFLT